MSLFLLFAHFLRDPIKSGGTFRERIDLVTWFVVLKKMHTFIWDGRHQNKRKRANQQFTLRLTRIRFSYPDSMVLRMPIRWY